MIPNERAIAGTFFVGKVHLWGSEHLSLIRVFKIDSGARRVKEEVLPCTGLCLHSFLVRRVMVASTETLATQVS